MFASIELYSSVITLWKIQYLDDSIIDNFYEEKKILAPFNIININSFKDIIVGCSSLKKIFLWDLKSFDTS